MTYKIIGDSCLDLTEELKKGSGISDDSPDPSGGECSGDR